MLDPDPSPQVCDSGFVTKTYRHIFKIAKFQPRTEATTGPLVTGQGRAQLPFSRFSGMWTLGTLLQSVAMLLLIVPSRA